jgi:signal transduction histidine kinase
LRQVVDALLSNAITYSGPDDEISIRVTVTGGWAHLDVTDTGIGIPDDEQEQVFDRFHRSSRVRDLGIPGAGLSLPTSRLIVERHCGTLTLNPGPDGGTTAMVCLPLSF